MGQLLGMSTVEPDNKAQHRTHPSVKERLPTEEMYHFMERRMRRDIELYNYAKTLALVDCDTHTTTPHTEV